MFFTIPINLGKATFLADLLQHHLLVFRYLSEEEMSPVIFRVSAKSLMFEFSGCFILNVLKQCLGPSGKTTPLCRQFT